MAIHIMSSVSSPRNLIIYECIRLNATLIHSVDFPVVAIFPPWDAPLFRVANCRSLASTAKIKNPSAETGANGKGNTAISMLLDSGR